MNKEDELVLVVGRDILFKEGSWQGLKTSNLNYYLKLIKENYRFIRRGEAEENPYWLQIIPYMIFNYKDKYFLYHYLNKAGEQRLKNDYQLGIAGHINPVDEKADPVEEGAKREWEEEVDYKGNLKKKIVGILNDDKRFVESVHVGLIYLFEGDSPDITIKEKETIEGGLFTLEEVGAKITKDNSWPPIIYNDYLLKRNEIKTSLVPSWDETAFEIVRAFEKRSHCIYYQIGAVFMRDKRILAVGYNGPPKGQPHCDEVGCAKEVDGKMLGAGSGKCRGAHAEMNAIVNACAEGINLTGSSVFCTYSPCYDCAKHMVNLGIKELVYKIKYDSEEGQRAFELLQSSGIPTRLWKKA